MKRLMRRMAAAALMSACLVSLSACSASQDEAVEDAPKISTDGTPVEDAMGDAIALSAVQTLGLSNEQLIVQSQLAKAQGDTVSADIYEEQLEVRSEMGALKSIDTEAAATVLLADGSYTTTVPVTFAEGTKLYVMNLNMMTQEIQAEFTDVSAGEEKDNSVSALMEEATVYSAIGIGTVFAVLVFISLLIYCFKFIHQWEAGKSAKPAPASAAPAVPAASAPAAAPAAVSADLCDDAELVAVISAAIAAYEGTSSNGLVVRSIRRVGGSHRR